MSNEDHRAAVGYTFTPFTLAEKRALAADLVRAPIDLNADQVDQILLAHTLVDGKPLKPNHFYGRTHRIDAWLKLGIFAAFGTIDWEVWLASLPPEGDA